MPKCRFFGVDIYLWILSCASTAFNASIRCFSFSSTSVGTEICDARCTFTLEMSKYLLDHLATGIKQFSNSWLAALRSILQKHYSKPRLLMLPEVSSSLHLPPKWHSKKAMEQPNSLELERWGAQASAFFRATFLRGLPPASSLSGRGKASPSEVSEELSSSCSSTDGNLVMCNNILITKNVSKWQFPQVKSINSQVKLLKKYYENTLMVLPVTALSCFVPVTAGWPEFVSQITNWVSNSGKWQILESQLTLFTAEKQATQATCKLQPPPSAGAALAILPAGDKLFQVLGLQVVCSHLFQVHTTYHKAQGTVRYGGAGDAEIAWEEAKEERGWRVLSTCNKVHFESAKRMPNHLTQNLFLHFPGPSLIPLLG